ncbi:cysteine peptidase family C39 domain-containing protein [Pannus brasiliensis CCIBt3594]|uniref:Cysteine peptidase family C39 domain-containing protein n=1 Tax=Pannus brasiliensis CCIBt3594 TaxID=1427578 RepID=A0AAW9QXS1_9CHRO
MYPEDAGAGGNQPRIDEQADPTVIQQEDQYYCGAACAQMLLRDLGISVEQKFLVKLISPSGYSISRGIVSADVLAAVMNTIDSDNPSRWQGGLLKLTGATPRELIETLMQTGPWIALLWSEWPEQAKIGHMVIVDSIYEKEFLVIRDPEERTRYKMRFSDFIIYWTEYGVYKIS